VGLAGTATGVVLPAAAGLEVVAVCAPLVAAGVALLAGAVVLPAGVVVLLAGALVLGVVATLVAPCSRQSSCSLPP
jgi:hypothetical protein